MQLNNIKEEEEKAKGEVERKKKMGLSRAGTSVTGLN